MTSNVPEASSLQNDLLDHDISDETDMEEEDDEDDEEDEDEIIYMPGNRKYNKRVRQDASKGKGKDINKLSSSKPLERGASSGEYISNEEAEHTVEHTSYIPELSARVIETVLNINSDLIQLCVEYQNRGWVQDPDFAIYQARLQTNLSYLASVGDYYLKPKQPLMGPPIKAQLDVTPLTVNQPTEVTARLNNMIKVAKKYQDELIQRWKPEMERQSRRAFEHLHQEERRRAQDNLSSTLSSASTTATADASSSKNTPSGEPIRKRKRVQDATAVLRITTSQPESGVCEEYVPVPPFIPSADVGVLNHLYSVPASVMLSTQSASTSKTSENSILESTREKIKL